MMLQGSDSVPFRRRFRDPNRHGGRCLQGIEYRQSLSVPYTHVVLRELQPLERG
jgi:hypothetical protein